ncbi:MAG: Trk family potassium uptake protein [Firmicutes bacterium]|nr:Trk family potassium uptake protein [Bacillota bacterium]
MGKTLFGIKLSTFQIIIAGFFGLIVLGTLLLMLPFASSAEGSATFSDAFFTSCSAVCVTGLVVRDTATYWTLFGQIVILVLIQIGGLGIVTVAAFTAMISGRKIGLLERSILQDSLSAHQLGGVVKMTGFIFKIAFSAEFLGALLVLPSFLKAFGPDGIFVSIFHSVSAFCNAGFDILGSRTGEFSSLTAFSSDLLVVIPTCLLITAGGIGFLTWEDMAANKFHFKRYRMQSKTILTAGAVLVLVPAVLLFFTDFTGAPFKERICLALFQSVTPRTAGFNTADLSKMTGPGLLVTGMLMLIGGAPGSTAGGMKTTTAAVLFTNAVSVIRRKKAVRMFNRKVEDSAVKTAAALLLMYLTLVTAGAIIISIAEGLPLRDCLFETASAIGTVGLTLGITPGLGGLSRTVLEILMFFGRVGGLTLMYAAISSRETEVAQYPAEKITVG